AQADKKIRNDEWIAFLGWRPHWMNIEYDLKYLDDPEGIWGSDYLIYTIANKDFLADDPNMKRFFEQFEMDAEAQGSWILEYGLNEVDIDEVAKDWITAHKDTVDEWLEGVETVDGDSAVEAIDAAFPAGE